ncbi:MAG: expansin EXLX1 family cellulose-binding protein [Polyangiales bacterium]
MSARALATALLLVSCASNPPAQATDGGFTPAGDQTPFGAVEDGIATFYDATGEGNCSFDASPDDLDVVALDSRQYQNAAWCGACVKVDGPKGTVKVRVVDKCPTCESRTHIDMSKSAFAKIADPSAGRVNVKWQFVPCAVTGPISYRFKEGSNAYWSAIQIRNHRMPIKSVEANVKGAWIALTRADYNYFLYEKGLGAGPYDLRVTSIEDKTVEDTGIPFAEATVANGKSQL